MTIAQIISFAKEHLAPVQLDDSVWGQLNDIVTAELAKAKQDGGNITTAHHAAVLLNSAQHYTMAKGIDNFIPPPPPPPPNNPILFVDPEYWKEVKSDPSFKELLGLEDAEPRDAAKNTVIREPLFKTEPKPNCWYLMYGYDVKMEDGTVWENWTKVRSWVYERRGLPSRRICLPEVYRRRSAAEKTAKRILAQGYWKKVKVVPGWS